MHLPYPTKTEITSAVEAADLRRREFRIGHDARERTDAINSITEQMKAALATACGSAFYFRSQGAERLSDEVVSGVRDYFSPGGWTTTRLADQAIRVG